MSNLFQQLGKNQPVQNQKFDINQAFQQFKQNPVEYLAKANFNIPDNIPANPQSIGQYLMQSGQLNQNMIVKAMQMMGRR